MMKLKQKLIRWCNNVPLFLVPLGPLGDLLSLESPGYLHYHGYLECPEHLEALAHLVHPEVTRKNKEKSNKLNVCKIITVKGHLFHVVFMQLFHYF